MCFLLFNLLLGEVFCIFNAEEILLLLHLEAVSKKYWCELFLLIPDVLL